MRPYMHDAAEEDYEDDPKLQIKEIVVSSCLFIAASFIGEPRHIQHTYYT